MIFANEWRGARGRYLDCFLHFWGLGSKRGNVKPSYLMEIHSEIGFHILVHHDPNTGEIVMKCAVYIVYNICNRIVGSQRPLSWLLLALFGLGSKRGNVKPCIQWKYTAKSVHCFTFWSITAQIQARSLWNVVYIVHCFTFWSITTRIPARSLWNVLYI